MRQGSHGPDGPGVQGCRVGGPHPVKAVILQAFRGVMPVELTVQDHVFHFMDLDAALWGEGGDSGVLLCGSWPSPNSHPLGQPRLFSSADCRLGLLYTQSSLWLRPLGANPSSGAQLSHPHNLRSSDKREPSSRRFRTRSESATSYLQEQGQGCLRPLRGGARRRGPGQATGRAGQATGRGGQGSSAAR